MEDNRSKYNNQLQINDLIDDAVENAIARRHEALDSEAALLPMSDEEAKSVAGGESLSTIGSRIIQTPIILGKVFIPVTIGLIAEPNPSTLYS